MAKRPAHIDGTRADSSGIPDALEHAENGNDVSASIRDHLDGQNLCGRRNANGSGAVVGCRDGTRDGGRVIGRPRSVREALAGDERAAQRDVQIGGDVWMESID